MYIVYELFHGYKLIGFSSEFIILLVTYITEKALARPESCSGIYDTVNRLSHEITMVYRLTGLRAIQSPYF